MSFTAVAVVAGLALGFACGGRAADLERSPLRWWGALVAGLVLQVAAELLEVASGLGLVLVGGSYVALLAFAVANLRRTGMPVVLVGLVLNVVVIAVNSGMPVRAGAITAAGLAEPEEVASLDFGAKRHLEDEDDRLTFLGDIIPVRPTGEVLSFGDLILAVGVADVLFRLLRPANPCQRTAPPVPSDTERSGSIT